MPDNKLSIGRRKKGRRLDYGRRLLLGRALEISGRGEKGLLETAAVVITCSSCLKVVAREGGSLGS
jgi:hypothetical protein